MYSISLPIHVYQAGPTEFYVPAGLARDLMAHLRFEPILNVICPIARTIDSVSSPYLLNLKDYPGLQMTLLPYYGSRGLFLKLFEVVRILRRTALKSSVWHTGCSTNFLELSSFSFYVGRFFAPKVRVLCLDSDPASMMDGSGIWERWKAPIIRARYRRWVHEVDATIFVGVGVAKTYSKFSRRFVTTGAVWLQEGELADREDTIEKFEEPQMKVVRLTVPTRLTEWKGVDDVLDALEIIHNDLPPWHLDIIGNGPMKEKLLRKAEGLKNKVSFIDEIEYGEPFFSQLRSYHIVLIPTRGLEDARIAYDAAASGSLIVHSGTSTLNKSLQGVRTRWEFEPGNIRSLADAILRVFAQRNIWRDAALQGVEAMSGRTIQEMHEVRSIFLRSLVD